MFPPFSVRAVDTTSRAALSFAVPGSPLWRPPFRFEDI